jgi:hypothetical protein
MGATNREQYDQYDETIWEKVVFDDTTNGYVVIHKHHGRHEREGNLKIALKLVALGYAVELLEASPTVLSPDATINSEIWEFKNTIGGYSSVQSRLREGKEQSANILIALPSEFVIGDILRGVVSAINVDKNRKIQMVGLLFDFEVIFWSRFEIKRKDFSKFKHYFE